MLIALLEQLWSLICRHEFIRDRRPDGTLGLRCMKCMKRTQHNLVRLVEWKPDYVPIDPIHQPDFPPPLEPLDHRRAA
jgi:hypothetical protein